MSGKTVHIRSITSGHEKRFCEAHELERGGYFRQKGSQEEGKKGMKRDSYLTYFATLASACQMLPDL